MADTFGGITIPLDPAFAEPGGLGTVPGGVPGQAAIPAQVSTDPTLGVLMAYLVAWLNTDAAALAAWQVAGIGPGTRPVEVVRFADPNDETTTFEPDRLPALYCWRAGGKYEWLAEDWETEQGTIKLLWVLPNVMPEDQQDRAPFVNGMQKAIYTGFSRGRTPSWVVPRDTDPLAATEGSYLGSWLQACTAYPVLDAWRLTTVRVKAIDDSPAPGVWRALEITMTVREKLTVDVTDALRFAITSPTNGDDMTITNPATGAVLAEGYLSGTPVSD